MTRPQGGKGATPATPDLLHKTSATSSAIQG